MIQYGKKITLFLVDGNADGIVTAELSNWNGKAIKLPRVSVASCNREDIEGVGVYFLFSEDDNGERAVYIGEAENIKNAYCNISLIVQKIFGLLQLCLQEQP